MDRSIKAGELFLQGYNCAQAVVGAYLDCLNMDKETALKVASPFGGGMGRMREVCGAVSGMYIVLGNIKGYSNSDAKAEKVDLYKTVQSLAEQFKEKNGSIICRELLSERVAKDNSPIPSERNESYYKNRSCVDMVTSATAILQKYLEDKKML